MTPSARPRPAPAGHTLRYRSLSRGPQIFLYKADAATCTACPLKARCTPSARGRVVSRSYDQEYLDRVRTYHATEPYKKALRKRSVWVEPLFAEAKEKSGTGCGASACAACGASTPRRC
jgi:hypothetical protein